MKKIFITGTFRVDWNKNYNPKLAAALEAKGFECYLPQRDTEQNGNRKNTFDQNTHGIKNADILIAVGANSQTANWGFEIGLAYALNKPVIIITDKPDEVNLMTEGAATQVLAPDNINDIENYIDELVDRINAALNPS